MRLIYEPHTRVKISGSRLHAGSSRPLTRYMRVLAPHAARCRAMHAPCTRHARAMHAHPAHALRRRLSQTWEPDGAAKYAALAASWLVAIGEASEASYDASGRGAAFAAPLVPIL